MVQDAKDSPDFGRSASTDYGEAWGSFAGNRALTLRAQGRRGGAGRGRSAGETEQPVIEEVTPPPVMSALLLEPKGQLMGREGEQLARVTIWIS